jgi:hypothetical protein
MLRGVVALVQDFTHGSRALKLGAANGNRERRQR